MADVKDLQARLDEKAKEQAKKEWADDIKKILAILEPYKDALYHDSTKEEKAVLVKEWEMYFSIDSSGWPKFFNNMKCPAGYIRRRQSDYSDEFMKKVETLKEDVENLYNEVEGMQR